MFHKISLVFKISLATKPTFLNITWASISLGFQASLILNIGIWGGWDHHPDDDMTSKVSIQVPIGPATHSRSKQFKEALNGLVREVWSQANLWRAIEGDENVSHGGKFIIQIQFCEENLWGCNIKDTNQN